MTNKEIESILDDIGTDYNLENWSYDQEDQSFDFYIDTADFYFCIYLKPETLTPDNARKTILQKIYDEINEYDGPDYDIPDEQIDIDQIQTARDNISQTAAYIDREIKGLPEIDGFTEEQMEQLDRCADRIHNDAYLYANPDLMKSYAQDAYIISHGKEIHNEILKLLPENKRRDIALDPINFFHSITNSTSATPALKYIADPNKKYLREIIKNLYLD